MQTSYRPGSQKYLKQQAELLRKKEEQEQKKRTADDLNILPVPKKARVEAQVEARPKSPPKISPKNILKHPPPPPKTQNPKPLIPKPLIPKPLKPKTIFIGPNSLLNKILSAVQSSSLLVLKGASGCGKTTAVKHICESKNIRLKIWHDIDFDGSAFDKEICNIFTDQSLGVKTVNLLDHLEEWNPARVTKLLAVLNRLQKDGRKTTPIIVTVNNQYNKVTNGICKFGSMVEVQPLEKYHAKRLLMAYAAKQKKKFDEKLMDGYDGDVRAIMCQIDNFNYGSAKDAIQLPYIKLCSALMGGPDRTNSDKTNLVTDEDDSALIIQAVTNNYLNVFDHDASIEISDLLSTYDMFPEKDEQIGRELLVMGMKCVKKPGRTYNRWNFPKRVMMRDVEDIIKSSIQSYAFSTLESKLQALDRITILKHLPIVQPKMEYCIENKGGKKQTMDKIRDQYVNNFQKTFKQREKTMRVTFDRLA
jgi:hypothetical protein